MVYLCSINYIYTITVVYDGNHCFTAKTTLCSRLYSFLNESMDAASRSRGSSISPRDDGETKVYFKKKHIFRSTTNSFLWIWLGNAHMFLDKIYLKMSKSGLAPIFSLEASMTCKKRTILNPWCQKKVVTMYNSDKATSDNVLT